MGACQDCRWWDELRGAAYGLCLFLSAAEGYPAYRVLTGDAAHPAWAMGAEFTTGTFWTTATFGCNQFAPEDAA